MKIKINAAGKLNIERAGGMKEQICPFDVTEGTVRPPYPCGDWCPLFGEPEAGNPDFPEIKTYILLCHNVVIQGEIVDERKTP